jgi:hypothetical protein
MIGNMDRLTLRRGGLPLFGALLGCFFFPSLASAQEGSPVTRAQFESNSAKGTYSYEIKEFTRGERLAVGAWTGSSHVVLRWAPTDGNDQRFSFLPAGQKFRIKTLRQDVGDRIFVAITPQGGAVAWSLSDDNNSQVFQIEWQPDGQTFALREGTKGEFLDVSSDGLSSGSVRRWSGVDGRNDRPKPNQLFQFLNPRLEATPAVGRAQFESNLAKGLYSYEIGEYTRGERLAVGAWNGSVHRVVRWAPSGGNDQRFLFLPEPGGKKFRIKTLRGDVNDRVYVAIAPTGAAIAWSRSDDNNSQVFQIEWQPDGRTFALREGTKGEFLDISGGGDALRWSGVDGRNDRPKSNQLFQCLNPRVETGR